MLLEFKKNPGYYCHFCGESKLAVAHCACGNCVCIDCAKAHPNFCADQKVNHEGIDAEWIKVVWGADFKQYTVPSWKPGDQLFTKEEIAGKADREAAAQHGFGGAIYVDGKWIVPNV